MEFIETIQELDGGKQRVVLVPVSRVRFMFVDENDDRFVLLEESLQESGIKITIKNPVHYLPIW